MYQTFTVIKMRYLKLVFKTLGETQLCRSALFVDMKQRRKRVIVESERVYLPLGSWVFPLCGASVVVDEVCAVCIIQSTL